MAIFPEIEPNTRSYDFGLFPLTIDATGGAGPTRFLHGNDAQSFTLTLGFSALSDAQASLIRDHFQGQGGSYRSFELPAIIWKGHTFSGNIASYTMLWRYSEPAIEEHLEIGRVNVTVALVSDGLISANAEIIASLAPGTATGA